MFIVVNLIKETHLIFIFVLSIYSVYVSVFPQTSATDVLHALGAMPAGFRESTLYKLSKQG